MVVWHLSTRAMQIFSRNKSDNRIWCCKTCITCIICKICKICKIWPAFFRPWYSSSTETNAHSCCCIPVPVFVWILNKSSSLQNLNQMFSILGWKTTSEIPGGLINTISWRFVCCNFFGTNNHEDIRILPWCFVCPIKRVENKQIWPWLVLDAWRRRVSSSALFCSTYVG